MKKFVLGLFLIISALAIAEDRYDYIEDKLELKYGVLSDSKQNRIKIDDIEVGVFRDKIYVEIEIETLMGHGGWKSFNKQDYARLAKEMADDIRGMLGVKDSVEITVVLDREIGAKEMLANGVY